MVYAVLCKVIAEICHQICIPLTPKEISHVLGEAVDEDMIELVCRYMCSEGKLVRCLHHTFTLRRLVMVGQHRANVLISSEYQQLGMQMMETAPNSFARYIPGECEHRFFEIRPSTIGKIAGLGLFVRCTRKIPQGCIFCEYRGRQLKSLPGNDNERLYVVQVRNNSTFIDGVTSGGEHLSLATFINDNGPEHMNAGMTEFSCHPGKVFLVAARDLNPGEEIFVLYGPKYWGFQSYGDGKVLVSSSNSEEVSSLSRSSPSLLSLPTGPNRKRNGDLCEKKVCSSSLSKNAREKFSVPSPEDALRLQADNKKGRSISSQLLSKSCEKINPGISVTLCTRASAGPKPDSRVSSGRGRGRKGKREREEDFYFDVMTGGVGVENSLSPCRSCGELVLRRTRALHQAHCGDLLVTRKLAHLDCMPLSSFTTVSHWDRLMMAIATSGSGKGERDFFSSRVSGTPPYRFSNRPTLKATSMVDGDNPQTFAHTYMDVVRDLEFSFQDVSDLEN